MASGSQLAFEQRYDPILITGAVGTVVNSESKADRVAAPVPQPLRTIAIRVEQLEDTSILVRVPADQAESKVPAASPNAPAAGKTKSQTLRTIACEPVVSALTDVAKLLEPGRCIT